MRAIISTLFIHENGLQTHIEQRCVVYVFCSFALAIPEEVDGMFFFFYFCLSFVANGSILTCLIERAFVLSVRAVRWCGSSFFSFRKQSVLWKSVIQFPPESHSHFPSHSWSSHWMDDGGNGSWNNRIQCEPRACKTFTIPYVLRRMLRVVVNCIQIYYIIYYISCT